MANETADRDIYSNIFIALESVIGISAVLGNTLVIWAVRINPSLQNATFYFIMSLALADLSVGVLVTPLEILVILGLQMHFHACLFMCCLVLILTNASNLSLLAIAIDRYLRIKIPIRYRTVITRRRIYLSIGITWIVSFLVSLVPMFGWNNRSSLDPKDRNYLSCQFLSVMSMDYMVYFNMFVRVLLPLVIMLALYIEIFYLIRKQLKLNIPNSIRTVVSYGKEYKTAKVLSLVLLMFALSWLPLSTVNCIIHFVPAVTQFKEYWPTIFLVLLLSHANSAVNPIIYAFKIKKFKDAYIQIIKTYILRRAVLAESGRDECTLDEIP
ncbi:hypothetical protein FKM82_016817 [Ascaphus truei]|uniref:adenosine receptor A3-like n=1 Tax=Ascaphus truei TaxID=8439 RepID=UPI003F59099F